MYHVCASPYCHGAAKGHTVLCIARRKQCPWRRSFQWLRREEDGHQTPEKCVRLAVDASARHGRSCEAEGTYGSWTTSFCRTFQRTTLQCSSHGRCWKQQPCLQSTLACMIVLITVPGFTQSCPHKLQARKGGASSATGDATCDSHL
jgi:hypothetical protein